LKKERVALISPDNLVVQGFWQGDFTTMERLCVRSFQAQGHEFHLYHYGEVKGVPEDVVMKDAAEIVPESRMHDFRCAQQFSDAFRIALLLKKGGWHTDLDNVLLKPLDFTSEYIFYRDHDETTMSLALSKAPAGSLLLQHCYDYVFSLSKEELACLPWQGIGAEFIVGAVEYFHMEKYAASGLAFDPVHHEHIRSIVDPTVGFDLSDSYSVHLFHAAWNDGPSDSTGEGFDLGRRLWGQRLDTDGEYPEACLYEKLKRRFDVSNDHAKL
jgi:Glycosyltransferase sugar-binding region containing DXD motif